MDDQAPTSPPLERTRPADRYYDFRAVDYIPRSDPTGKLRSINLLFESFRGHPREDDLRWACDAVRGTFGPDHTIWGVKHGPGGFAWELYWYNPHTVDRTLSVSRLLEAWALRYRAAVPIDEDLPYRSFSCDLDPIAEGRSDIDAVNLYGGYAVGPMSPGHSYRLDADGLRLKNTYFVFDPSDPVQLDHLDHRLELTLRSDDPRRDVASTLPAELLASRYIYLAHKPACDGIYFSGVPVDVLRSFLAHQRYPEDLQKFVADHEAELDHLTIDIGLDIVQRGGRWHVQKTGFYGGF